MRELNLSPDDLDALARITYAEARGEPFHGQLAVADVVLNRALAGRGWPSNVQGVIQQRNQFEPLRNRSSWRELPSPSPEFASSITTAVQQRASGQRPDASNGATFFLNPTITNQRGTHFASRVDPTAAIGRHAFYSATNRDPRPIPIPEYRMNLQLSAEASANSSAPTSPDPQPQSFERLGPFSVPRQPAITTGTPDITDLPIRPAMRPDATYGRAASAHAQPFSGIVFHTAGGPSTSLNAMAQYTQTPDTARGGTFGYHYLVDRDGSIHQTAPHSARTNHIKPPGSTERHTSVRDLDLSNTNALGIATLGPAPNEAQRQAALALAATISGRYGIDPSRVLGHGDLQRDRMSSEGTGLARSFGDNARLSSSVDPEIGRALGMTDEHRTPQAPTPRAQLAQTQTQTPTPRPPTPRQPTVAARANGNPMTQSELQGAYPDDLAQSVTDQTYGRFSSLVTTENLNSLFPDLSRREATGIGIGLASL